MADDSIVCDAMIAALAVHGLNLVGATAVVAYDDGLPAERRLSRWAPTARAAVVIGNGGGAFWDAYARARDRGDVAATAHPLDAYTRTLVERVLRPFVPRHARIVFPFDHPATPVSFQRLAQLAGLGAPSQLGVLVHPEYGPWIALRAALLLDADVVGLPAPARGFDPCPRCVAQSCVAACPAAAVSTAGWNVPRCAAERSRDDETCDRGCHARLACILGPQHRYPSEALVHHQGHARPGLLAVRA